MNNLNVPNSLTVFRLVLAPFVFGEIVSRHLGLALALFVVAAITDFLDGWIARHWNLRTKFGALLNPIADKLLMSGIFVAFWRADMVPWWLMAVVLGRDVYILLAVIVCRLRTSIREFPPSGWGKASTVAQIVFSIAVISQDVIHVSFVEYPIAVFGGLVLSLAIASGVDYTWRGIHVIYERQRCQLY